MAKVKALDGLRGLAATTVMLSHLTMWSLDRFDDALPALQAFVRSAADVAVLVFFVLSGVVIGLNEDGQFNRSSLMGYVLRRLVRIYPIYLVGLVLGIFASWTALDRISLSDLAFFQMWSSPAPSGNGPLWSLHYEMIFYALFPLLTMIRPWAGVIFTGCLACSLVLFFSSNHLLVVATYFSMWISGYFIAARLDQETVPATVPRQTVALLWLIVAYFLANPLQTITGRFAHPIPFAGNLPHPIVSAVGGLAIAVFVANCVGAALNVTKIVLFSVAAVVSISLAYAFWKHLFAMPIYQAAAVCSGVGLAALMLPSRLTFSGDGLGYLGRISYGVYATHTPLILLTLGLVAPFGPWPLLACTPLLVVAVLLIAHGLELWLQPRIHGAVRRALSVISARPDQAPKLSRAVAARATSRPRNA